MEYSPYLEANSSSAGQEIIRFLGRLIFWVVTPRIVVEGHQSFEGPCCLRLDGDNPKTTI